MTKVKKEHQHARRIFNLIAPVYHAVDPWVRKHYTESAKTFDQAYPLKGKSILDIGSGTGAWGAVLQPYDTKKVHGVDIAPRMITKAAKRYAGKITFSLVDGENLNDFSDNSFDIVTASYMMHGTPIEFREKILVEMMRVAKDMVAIHDFHGHQPAFVRFLEYMEKSDYKNFKKTFCSELESFFPKVYKLSLNKSEAIYFGIKNPDIELKLVKHLSNCKK